MNRFLSGEHGPKFVGYAVPPLWQRLAANLAFGLGVGIAVFGLWTLVGLE